MSIDTSHCDPSTICKSLTLIQRIPCWIYCFEIQNSYRAKKLPAKMQQMTVAISQQFNHFLEHVWDLRTKESKRILQIDCSNIHLFYFFLSQKIQTVCRHVYFLFPETKFMGTLLFTVSINVENRLNVPGSMMEFLKLLFFFRWAFLTASRTMAFSTPGMSACSARRFHYSRPLRYMVIVKSVRRIWGSR